MKKKIFTLLLAVAASVGTMFAEVTVTIDGIRYILDTYNKTAEVTYSAHLNIGKNYSGDIVIPRQITYNSNKYNVTRIGDMAFTGNNSSTYITSISIPNSVKSIGEKAFYRSTLITSVTIPNSVTSIGISAFEGCTGLTSVTLPNSITSIEASTFDYCTSLTSITIPNSVTSIGDWAFFYCSGLTSVTIGNSVTSIGYNAFSYCSGLTSIEIPNSVTSIGEGAFSGCSSLTSVTIPNSVTSIGNYAFAYCSSLTSVTIPNSVTSIGDYVFENCTGLTSVTIPNSVTSIGDYAFYNCSGLTSVTIPYSVTSIGSYAFYNCSGLTSIEIPSSVASIGDGAFMNCVNLTSVTCEAQTPPQIKSLYGTHFFKNVDCSQIPLYVPKKSVSAYQAAVPWREFDPIIGIGNCNGQNVTWLQTGGSDLGEMSTNNTEVWMYNPQYGAVGKKQGGGTGWLLTPSKNLLGMRSITLSFSHTHKFATVLEDELTLWVCADYQGSVEASSWQQLTISPYAANTNWTFVDVSIDVPLNMVGANTVFGFKYVSTSSGYATWEIKDLHLEAECKYVAPETYTITFLNYDGTELQVLTDVEEGTMPVYTGVTPTKPSNEQYTYTFNGWSPEIVEATEDATYTATFSNVLNTYTISANAANGRVEGTGEYACGTIVSLTAIPDNGYVFNRWLDGVKDNPRTITVTGDAEYTALFTLTEGFENIYTSEPVQKVIIDQKVFILRGDKTYTLQGQEVK